MPSAKWQVRVCSPSHKKFLAVVEKESTISGLIREISSIFRENYPDDTPLEKSFSLIYKDQVLDPHAAVGETLKNGGLVYITTEESSNKIEVNGKHSKNANGVSNGKPEKEKIKSKSKDDSSHKKETSHKGEDQGEGGEEEEKEAGDEEEEKEAGEDEEKKEVGEEEGEEQQAREKDDAAAEKSDEPGASDEEAPTIKTQQNSKSSVKTPQKKGAKVRFAEPPVSDKKPNKRKKEDSEDNEGPAEVKTESNGKLGTQTEKKINPPKTEKDTPTKTKRIKTETEKNTPDSTKAVKTETEKNTPDSSKKVKTELPHNGKISKTTLPKPELKTPKTETQTNKDEEIMPPPKIPTKKEISPPKNSKKDISPNSTPNSENGKTKEKVENGQKDTTENATPLRKRTAETNAQTPTPAKKIKVDIPKSVITTKSPFSITSPPTSFSSAFANLTKSPFSLASFGLNKGFPVSPLPTAPLSSAPLFPKSNTTKQV